jgi:hypothetical protein
MSHPPSSLTLTISSGSEWAESTPALGIRGVLSFIVCALLDAYRENRQVDEGGADEESTRQWAIMWKNVSEEMGLGNHGHQHARAEVGRCRGDVVRRGDVVVEGEWGHHIGGGDMGDRWRKVRGGSRKET